MKEVLQNLQSFLTTGASRVVAVPRLADRMLGAVGAATIGMLLLFQLSLTLHAQLYPHLVFLSTEKLFSRDRFEMLEAVPDDAQYSRYLWLQGLKALRAASDENSTVLTVLNNGEYSFLGGRKQMRDVDVRMLPFYNAKSLDEATAILKGMGVTHIYTTPVDFPTKTASFIQEIISNNKISKLVFSNPVIQVYRLK